MTQTKIAVGMVDASGTPGSGNFLRGDGAWNAAGIWTLISSSVASNSASLTITGLSTTYATYAVQLVDMLSATDGADAHILLGDSSGLDSGASDYSWATQLTGMDNDAWAAAGAEDLADAQIKITENAVIGASGNATGEGFNGMYFLTGTGTVRPQFFGSGAFVNVSTAHRGTVTQAGRNAVIVLDRIQLIMSSGNITSGRMTVWGIAHA